MCTEGPVNLQRCFNEVDLSFCPFAFVFWPTILALSHLPLCIDHGRARRNSAEKEFFVNSTAFFPSRLSSVALRVRNPLRVLSCSGDSGHPCQPPWPQRTSASIDQVTQCTVKGKHFLQSRRGPWVERVEAAMWLTPGDKHFELRQQEINAGSAAPGTTHCMRRS